jgi:N-acetylglucosaminyl-diphospho-decaprenol L-rhamnosyltransferase
MATMRLLIVIANYKITNLTIDCLHSISNEIPNLPGCHVAVCENGSGDDSTERIQNAIKNNGWDSWCSLTALSTNLGFTGGTNAIIRPALRSADAPQYVLLLNADTIVRPNAFRALVDFMDAHLEVGIAGSRLEDLDGTPQRSVFRFPSAMGEFETSITLGVVTRLLDHWIPVPTDACEADWVSGASMIVRRDVFRDIGLLDEGYFTLYEDVDFCFSARKAGWSIWYVPASRVVHLVGQSTKLNVKKRQPAYAFEARRRYFLKNHGPLNATLADIAKILGLTFWRLRVLFGKHDFKPSHYLRDSIRHSVLLTGFKLQDVKNPALVVGQDKLRSRGGLPKTEDFSGVS